MGRRQVEGGGERGQGAEHHGAVSPPDTWNCLQTIMLCFVLGFHPSSSSSSSLVFRPHPSILGPSAPRQKTPVFWHKYLQTEGSRRSPGRERRTGPVSGRGHRPPLPPPVWKTSHRSVSKFLLLTFLSWRRWRTHQHPVNIQHQCQNTSHIHKTN